MNYIHFSFVLCFLGPKMRSLCYKTRRCSPELSIIISDLIDRDRRNLDIRDALLQMLKVMRDNNKKIQQNQFEIKKSLNEVGGSGGVEKKIDNISTFLLRMNNKIEALSRSGGGGRTAILETLAQESYDIISLLPTYIDNTRKAVYNVGNDTRSMFRDSAVQCSIGSTTGCTILVESAY